MPDLCIWRCLDEIRGRCAQAERKVSQSNPFATGKRSPGILVTVSQEMAKPLLLSCTTMMGGGLADV